MSKVLLDMTVGDVHVPSASARKKRGKKVVSPPKKRLRGTGRLRMTLDHPVHGKFEIRHMRDGSNLFRAAFPLEPGAAELEGPTWVQIAKPGHFDGHSAGPFDLDDKIFADILRNYRDVDHGLVQFDFEHASEQDPTSGSIPTEGAPAQGWIKALEVRAGGLYALVDWLEPARSYIRSGKYKSVSPAIRFNARHPVTGKPIGARLTSVALTNQPFLRGMQPLAAKDALMADEDIEVTIEDLLEEALEAHELEYHTTGDEPDEDAAMTMADKVDPNGATTIALSEAQTRIAELTLTLREQTKIAETANAELVTLRDWKEKREERDITDRVNEAFEVYKDKKGLQESDKECMLVALKAKPEAFEKAYPRVLPHERHLLRDLTGQRDTTPQLLEPQPLPDTVALANRLMSEEKISYLAAMDKAVLMKRRSAHI